MLCENNHNRPICNHFLINTTKWLNNNAYERRKRCKRIKRNEYLINTFCNRPNKKKSLITNQSLPPTLPSFISQTISTTKFYSRSCSTININITRRLTVQIPKGLQVNNLRTWPACGARCVHQASIQLQVRYQVEETDTILTEDSLQNWYLMAGQHILSYIQWRTVFRWSFMQSLLCLGNIDIFIIWLREECYDLVVIL